MPNNIQTTVWVVLISHASKVLFKILQARFQQYMSLEHPYIQAGFRKSRKKNQKSNSQHSLDHRKKQGNSRESSTSVLLTMPKPLTMWITTNYGKFFKRWEYQTTWPASWEICMQVRKQHLELDMEQHTGFK